MEVVYTIKEYGIPDGKIIGTFGLDRLDDVITEVCEHRDIILKGAETGEVLTFEDFTPYHVTGTVKLHENGLVIKFEEHNDKNAKHEDAGKAELYILEERIAYIVTEVDPRANNEYKINTEKSQRYQARLGELVNIPTELKEATNLIEKIVYLFTMGKRKKLKKERDYCLLRIENYINRLVNIDINLIK
jgi:hypothetical protein